MGILSDSAGYISISDDALPVEGQRADPPLLAMSGSFVCCATCAVQPARHLCIDCPRRIYPPVTSKDDRP
jgi:hypothetical protein